MVFFFFQAEDGIRDATVTGVQTCALPIYYRAGAFHRGWGLRIDHILLTPALAARCHAVEIDRDERKEIGRASCRERVEISVVAVAEKKNKIEEKRRRADRRQNAGVDEECR